MVQRFSRLAMGTQAKLAIGPPGDAYEREAGSAAEAAINSSSHGAAPAYDFRNVRVHTDGRAAASARAVGALAYTVGSDIAFGTGQYAPSSPAGLKLIAHELAHVIQQDGGNGEAVGAALQRQDGPSGDDDDDDKGEEKKPKTPFDPPDQIANCSVDFLHLDKFVKCCTEAIGDSTICTSQLKKFKDLFKKFGPDACPPKAKKPDGTCCPLPMLYDPLAGKCSKTISPLGKQPPSKPSPSPPPTIEVQKCLPGEQPTLYGGCCAPGQLTDIRGMPCVSAQLPAPTPKTPTPAPNPPPARALIHFKFDLPAVGAEPNESTLKSSLTATGQTEWTDLLNQMRANSAWKVQLVGKASPEGTDAYNLDLGGRRAKLVAQALAENGIDASRIVDVKPECTRLSVGVFTCGETGAVGPDDRQVKVLFLPNP
jgi:hypothetical protein